MDLRLLWKLRILDPLLLDIEEVVQVVESTEVHLLEELLQSEGDPLFVDLVLHVSTAAITTLE